jgi:transposase
VEWIQFLESAALRWAAAEGVSEDAIATVLRLHERSVDEIVAKLRPGELEQLSRLRSAPRGADTECAH